MTNGIQFYVIANLDKTSQLVGVPGRRRTSQSNSGSDADGASHGPGTRPAPLADTARESEPGSATFRL